MLVVTDVVRKDGVHDFQQGSICGPFICNFMVSPLLWQLEGDLLIMIVGQWRSRFKENAVECFRIVGQWSSSVGVSLAITIEKTVAMLLKGSLFSRGLEGIRSPIVRLDRFSIRYAKLLKYLGEIVGARLSGRQSGVHSEARVYLNRVYK